MNRLTEILALDEIDARLSREDPALAAALSFGCARRETGPPPRRKLRSWFGAFGSLAALALLLCSLLALGRAAPACGTSPGAPATSHPAPAHPVAHCRAVPAAAGAG
jgi:hypothetical protein